MVLSHRESQAVCPPLHFQLLRALSPLPSRRSVESLGQRPHLFSLESVGYERMGHGKVARPKCPPPRCLFVLELDLGHSSNPVSGPAFVPERIPPDMNALLRRQSRNPNTQAL